MLLLSLIAFDTCKNLFAVAGPCAGLMLLGAAPEQLSQLPLVWEEHTAGLGVGTRNHCGIGPERIPRGFGDNEEEDCHTCLRLFDIFDWENQSGKQQ